MGPRGTSLKGPFLFKDKKVVGMHAQIGKRGETSERHYVTCCCLPAVLDLSKVAFLYTQPLNDITIPHINCIRCVVC